MIKGNKNKLFILGNGFDIAHSLPTRYRHFRKYLYLIQERQPNQFDDRNRNALIAYLDSRCNGADWKDIEYALGLFPLYIKPYNPEKENRHEKEQYAFYQSCILSEVIESFEKWVNSISVDSVKPKSKMSQIIKSGDFAFLTFNYTPVLEKVYHVEDDSICHIHGKQGERIIMGHNRLHEEANELWLLSDVAPYLHEEFFRLYKNPIVNIRRNQDFFDSLTELLEIYSFGFSFSDPDHEYVKLICEKTTEKTVWFFNAFSSEDERERYKEILKENGFHGSFATFAV